MSKIYTAEITKEVEGHPHIPESEKEYPVTGTLFNNNTKRGIDVISQNGTTIKNGDSSETPLTSGSTFTGEWQERIQPEMIIAFAADQKATIRAQFSTNGTDIDSTLTYYFTPGEIEPPHRLVIARKYYRITVENTGGADMTYMRLQTSVGQFGQLTSPVNSTIAQDADAILTRNALPADIEIAFGKFEGYSIVPKRGKNSDVDSGTVPEDVIEAGGTYTGFPSNATPQRMWLVSSDAGDTGDVTFQYLASNTSTEWQSATVTLQGTTPVDTGIDAIRAHTMLYNNSNATTFNAGTITLRNAGSTVTWLTIIPGRSQSNYAVYTVPYKNTGLLKRIVGKIRGGNATTVDGSFWIRNNGSSPRYRVPFTIGLNAPLDEENFGGQRLPALTDISMRILSTSGNNIDVTGGFDLVLVKDVDG